MKKLIKLSILFCLLFSFQVDGQEETFKKSNYIGGTLNFSIDEYESVYQRRYSEADGVLQHERTYFAVSPNWVKDVTKYWQMGFVGQYSYSKLFDEVASQGCCGWYTTFITTKSHSVGGGLFLRYVFNPKNKLNFYLQPNINYNYQKDKESFEDNRNGKVTSIGKFTLGLGVGVRYKIGQRWRLALSMGGVNYLVGVQVNDKSKETAKFSEFKSNFNLSSIGLGFEFRL